MGGHATNISEQMGAALAAAARNRPCRHDSERADGWLDTHCLRCGKEGYWHDGFPVAPSGPHMRALAHPSGKLLLQPAELAPKPVFQPDDDPPYRIDLGMGPIGTSPRVGLDGICAADLDVFARGIETLDRYDQLHDAPRFRAIAQELKAAAESARVVADTPAEYTATPRCQEASGGFQCDRPEGHEPPHTADHAANWSTEPPADRHG